MASTNKTTNYELSQFVSSDKPAWLGDYNADMAKIDTAMKANADSATGADGKATANATAIGTIANLTTDAKTNLVVAINEVDAHADSATTSATQAVATANTASNNASSALSEILKFNLSARTTLSPASTGGTINTSLTNVQFATDTSSSVFKVYGRVYLQNLASVASSAITITLGTTSLRPTSAYDINASVIASRLVNNVWDTTPRNLHINTNGVITFELAIPVGTTEASIIIPPCLYFNSDFGDQ